MFFSYQQEYPKDIKDIVKAIFNWEASTERMSMWECGEYAEGRNTFINKFKRLIWSDDQKTMVENVYAPNFKTSYGFYENMISQKNNALYGEMPTVDGLDIKQRNNLGFALKSAGKSASTFGYSVVYEKYDGTYEIFDTLNCMLYTDDKTNELVKMIRYWFNEINDDKILYFEIYDTNGITTYQKKETEKEPNIFIPLQPYKKIINSSSLGITETIQKLNRLPIVVYKNNEKNLPDLKLNVKYKIDLIDIIQSGLANNIDEFSDVWMSINVPDATEENVQQVKETARRTKAIIFAGSNEKNSVDFKTLEIPYQARQTAVNMLKQELVEDTGVIDFKAIQGTATATEINARTYKLQQKVSDFEWFSDICARELIEIWQDYNNSYFEINVTFNKLFIRNNTEIINNAIALYDKISKRAFLKQLQIAGIIDDVDEELQEQDKESISKFNLSGDVYGQSTQPNGQDTEPNEQDFTE